MSLFYDNDINSNYGYKMIINVHTRGVGWSCSSLPVRQMIDNPSIANQTNVFATNYCSWTGIFCNFQDVSNLVLKGYSIKGSIPSPIGLLQQLSQLDLSSNILIGSIPSSIGGANMG